MTTDLLEHKGNVWGTLFTVLFWEKHHQPLNNSIFVSQHITHMCQYLTMAVLVFAGLVTSSEPIRVWSQDTATVQEAHTMRIKVSTNRLRAFRWRANG